eukprot:TRINITY_DN7311_c0_g2_i5.p1 TRINITY_DN7311_c0_g2~~TRINITY_DN7311_c0_g2_i5.p1  ORF type:complete len:1018 (-),score=220.59 TRINITY_DN7311_c0_g2_i5:513-3566(-)
MNTEIKRKRGLSTQGLITLLPGDELVSLFDRERKGIILSSGDQDLLLRKGDVLTFVQRLPNNWLRVVNETSGQLGVVPHSFVISAREKDSIDEFLQLDQPKEVDFTEEDKIVQKSLVGRRSVKPNDPSVMAVEDEQSRRKREKKEKKEREKREKKELKEMKRKEKEREKEDKKEEKRLSRIGTKSPSFPKPTIITHSPSLVKDPVTPTPFKTARPSQTDRPSSRIGHPPAPPLPADLPPSPQSPRSPESVNVQRKVSQAMIMKRALSDSAVPPDSPATPRTSLLRAVSQRSMSNIGDEKYIEPSLAKAEVPVVTLGPTKLDRSSQGLLDVDPQELHPDLQKVYLQMNKICTLPVDHLALLQQLKVINLAYNRLKAFPVGLLDLPLISKINLKSNFIPSLPTDMHRLTSLVYLDISHNGITNLPVQCLPPQLETLISTRNGICELPDLSHLTCLRHLNLTENNIADITPVASLTALTSLSLGHNCIREVEVLATLTRLEEVELSHNEIEEIPASWTTLSHLKRLFVRHNRVHRLGEGLFSQAMPSLEEVNLRFNDLEEVAPLFQVKSLKRLDVTNNRIGGLGASFLCLQLQHLCASFNRIGEVPSEMLLLQRLQVLNLSHNGLSAVPKGVLSLPELTSVALGYNSISSMDEEKPSSDLQEMFLSGNPLGKVPEWVYQAESLSEVYAAHIGCSEISPAIANLGNLTRCDLGHNAIQDLPGSLGSVIYLESLDLSHNELQAVGPQGEASINVDDWFLQELNLSFNQIKELPQAWQLLTNRGTLLFMDGNSVDTNADVARASSRFQVGWSEMIGKRPSMEDAFLIQGQLGHPHQDLFGLFDGHAGSTAAKYAAKHMPALFLQLKEEKGALHAMHHIFSEVNARLREELSVLPTNVQNCGATAAIAYIDPERQVYVANLGDTRVILCRQGQAFRLTHDHKPLEENARIRDLGGFVSGDATTRVNGMLAVSRALGDFYMHPFILDVPYITHFQADATDEFLIIACTRSCVLADERQVTECGTR